MFYSEFGKKFKILQFIIKTWEAEASHAMTRFGRNASNYDLHDMAGGLPLLAITAPNVRLSSERKREVCKQGRKLTSLI